MTQCLLTTIDNPYDPFEDFTSWFMFDTEKGYDTCGKLDRLAQTSEELSDEENEQRIKQAIDRLIKHDFLHIYQKVTKNLAVA